MEKGRDEEIKMCKEKREAPKLIRLAKQEAKSFTRENY